MKKNLLLCFTLLVGLSVTAQDYLGFINSNYCGITGAFINPANIADNRMRFDMTLGGLSTYGINNYVGIKRKDIIAQDGAFWGSLNKTMKGDNTTSWNDSQFQQKYLRAVDDPREKSLFFSSRVALPSFLIHLNLWGKNAIGLNTSFRTYVNVDGVSPELARLLYADVGRTPGFDVKDLYNVNINNKYLSANAMSWMEYAITFAHVFKDDGEHYFKGGGTVKILQGLAAAYVNVKNLKVNFNGPLTPADTAKFNVNDNWLLNVIQSDVNYGHSENLEIPDPNKLNGGDKNTNPAVDDPTLYGTLLNGYPKFASFPGYGFDIGGIYEWRPDHASYRYEMDGKQNIWRRDKNKYKLKAGLSILDMGGIKYAKGKYSNNFTINTDSIKYRVLKTGAYPVYDIDRIIDSLSSPRDTKGTFKVALPTAIVAQVDYALGYNFYVDFMALFAVKYKNREAKVHDFTNISLTPRWDHKWFGVAVPLAYNEAAAIAKQPFRVGSMIRLGPLAIGTNDMGNWFGKKDIFGVDLYVILKVPIPYAAPRDKDKDHVSDRKDKCKTVPGTWEFLGCPDRDGDHIQDKDDKCPDVPGLKELQGCPDKDGDGITDLEDACPDDKGLLEFKGCPDRDGDKIIDKDDECPDDPGLKEFFGCPDKDGDGTPDKLDNCPDIPGPKEYKGCPDKDGDTVLDKDDACPDVPGAVENKGCPWPDTDKDGVYDKDDKCPTTPGPKELGGCPPAPPIKAAEQKILERAFASLEFATAKDIIKPKSFPSLNDLAKIMKEHSTDWKLKLSGHTDNDGTPEKNMILSEKRAKAVMNYLVKKGVKAENIIVEWFGQTVPIADNSTPAGKQKNRRVEMKVQFKQ